MDIHKINAWIANILNEDGHKLHPGSITTLADIKTEINKPAGLTGSDLICPFCEETDFDLIGLKNHIKNYCRVFREIDIID